MPKSLLIAGLVTALASCAAPLAAHANNCETFPGSQQYTDQGCDKPYDNSAASQQNGAGATPPNRNTGLRDRLRRALSEGSTKPNPKTASTALANAVANARSGVQRALDEAANAPEPKQLAKAQRDYMAAMTELDRAYDAAADAASSKGEAELLALKQNNDRNFGASADRLGLLAPIQTQPAQAAPPPLPNNITEVKGFVYVCDGVLAGANNVSCREISADGQQCTNVMIADGDMSWRDSIATPCRADELAKRSAFLDMHPDIAAEVDGFQARFGMDSEGTRAEINRLTGQPDDPSADQAAAAMSPQCRAVVQRYIAAAQVQDGAGATEQYAALKQAGGCGVLEQAERQARPPGDPRFVSRGDTPMLDQTFGACDRQPDLCNQIANQLKAGTSSQTIAAMYSNAIGIGLELGSMMGNTIVNAQALSAPAQRVISTPNRAPRSPTAQYPRAISCSYSGCVTTNGQGPTNHLSDITGLGTH
jgi:hypothetical protein